MRENLRRRDGDGILQIVVSFLSLQPLRMSEICVLLIYDEVDTVIKITAVVMDLQIETVTNYTYLTVSTTLSIVHLC